MIIKSMNVKNFRSILDETLIFDNLTALVGANGSGKSSFLHSLELFQTKRPKITSDDFYNNNTDNDIVFGITFTNLSNDAKKQFKKYIQNDELTIERVFKFTDEDKISDTCHGFILHNPDFIEIRKCDKATIARSKYKELKLKQEYTSFPNWENHDKTKNYLTKWEEDYADKCTRIKDSKQLFASNEVVLRYLEKYVKMLYISAVRDASLDATEGKNSVFADLIQIAVKNKLMEKKDVQKFYKKFQRDYQKILYKNNKQEISDLSKSLTTTLKRYVPNAKINLSWSPLEDVQIPLPSAIVNLVEDEYSTTVDRTGHGLQRVFIMTLLQHISTINETSAGSTSVSDFPTLVLIIEEPELYQHPNRQRHLSEICIALSKCEVDGVSSKIQVVYSTHSPHFVGLDRINQIRLLRKQNNIAKLPKITKISSTNIKELVAELSKYHGSKFTEFNILPLLRHIRNPWINEGFFSKCVILVEGDSDRAAILGASSALKINLESEDISIIPCFGKGGLDKVAIIFKQLCIPTYVIWDNDKDSEKNSKKNSKKYKSGQIKNNRILLKLFGQKETNYPSHVKNDHAVIEGTLETMLKNEIGDKYDKMLDSCVMKYGLKKSDAEKNPTVIKTILEDLEKCGGKIPITLKQILEKIEQLNQQ